MLRYFDNFCKLLILIDEYKFLIFLDHNIFQTIIIDLQSLVHEVKWLVRFSDILKYLKILSAK